MKKTLQDKLKRFSYKNTLVYQDLYILENIFREYLQNKGVKETDFDVANADEKAVLERIQNVRGLRKTGELRHSLKGKIVKQEHYLNYTDLCDLGEIVDIFRAKENIKKQKKPLPKKYQQPLISDAQEINPVRNPVMHTNEITDAVFEWRKIKNLIDYIEKLK